MHAVLGTFAGCGFPDRVPTQRVKTPNSARVTSDGRYRPPDDARVTSEVRYLVGLGEGDGDGPGAVLSISTVKTSVAFGGMITAPVCGSV